jgi:uncharacterized repeat protein (TIGR02543 family)
LALQTPKFYLAGSKRARKSGFLRSIDRKNLHFKQALKFLHNATLINNQEGVGNGERASPACIAGGAGGQDKDTGQPACPDTAWEIRKSFKPTPPIPHLPPFPTPHSIIITPAAGSAGAKETNHEICYRSYRHYPRHRACRVFARPWFLRTACGQQRRQQRRAANHVLTVSFYANGGTPAPQSQQIAKGGTVNRPSPDPEKEGFTFAGWYKEAAGTNAWNFTSDTVNAALTLHAKWNQDTVQPEQYTVTFIVDGGEWKTEQVTANSPVNCPSPDPEKEGHTFAGWYKEAACTNAWNFASDTVNAALTLYAKWNEDSVQPLVISIGGINAVLSPANVLTINVDSHVLTPAEITLSAADKAKLAGKNLTVDINKGSSTLDTVSLAWVYYLRKALESASPASVDIDTTNLTPVFDGREWWTNGNGYTNYEKNVYAEYALSDGQNVEIVNKVIIKKDTGKYWIEYDRDLKVSQLIWYNNNYVDPVPFTNFGLSKKNDSSAMILPFSGAGTIVGVVLGGNRYEDTNPTGYYPVVSNFAAYVDALKDAGLHPDDGVLLDHSHVRVNFDVAAANVAGNGMYDFILAYYNPPANSQETAPGDPNYYGATEGNKKSLLPQWPVSGLTFNGSQNGSSTRDNIGGIPVGTTTDRKAVAGSLSGLDENNTAKTYQVSEPRADFIGNLTVPMANYMVSNLHIDAFENTNIVGDGTSWKKADGSELNNGLIPGSKNVKLPNTINVGFIGNYGNIDIFEGRLKGVTDVKGKIAKYNSNNTNTGYINIWDLSSTEITNGGIGIDNFNIIHIRNSNNINVLNKVGMWSLNPAPANVIIYPIKYQSNVINGEISYLKPQYRAFLDGNTPKIMPVDASFSNGNSGAIGNASDYKGTITSTTGNVYSIEEDLWITEADTNNGAAPSPISYSSTLVKKWDVMTFAQLNAVVASASPASLPTRLAAAGRQALEAVLPAKKKSRFEEAFLG